MNATEPSNATNICYIDRDTIAILNLAGQAALGLGLGCQMDSADIFKYLKHPGMLMLGVVFQCFIYPIWSYLAAGLFSADTYLAMSVIITVAAPSHPIASIFVIFSRGDVTYSVILIALSIIISIVEMPLVVFVYGLEEYDISKYPYVAQAYSLLSLVVPAAIGALLFHFFRRVARVVNKVALLIGCALFVFTIVVISCWNKDTLVENWLFWFIGAFLPITAMFTAFGLTGFMGISYRLRRTMALVMAIQSIYIAGIFLDNVYDTDDPKFNSVRVFPTCFIIVQLFDAFCFTFLSVGCWLCYRNDEEEINRNLKRKHKKHLFSSDNWTGNEVKRDSVSTVATKRPRAKSEQVNSMQPKTEETRRRRRNTEIPTVNFIVSEEENPSGGYINTGFRDDMTEQLPSSPAEITTERDHHSSGSTAGDEYYQHSIEGLRSSPKEAGTAAIMSETEREIEHETPFETESEVRSISSGSGVILSSRGQRKRPPPNVFTKEADKYVRYSPTETVQGYNSEENFNQALGNLAGKDKRSVSSENIRREDKESGDSNPNSDKNSHLIIERLV